MNNTILELLLKLKTHDIELRLDGERLIVNAPKGALDSELRQSLKQKKPLLIEYLKGATPTEPLPPLAAMSNKIPGPLSYAQKRWWLLEELTGNSSINHLPTSWKITGPLNYEILKRALDAVVSRHETLRTSFNMLDGEPQQVVHEHVDFDLPLIDLSGTSKEQQAVKIAEAFDRVRIRPMSLLKAPLFRGMLIHLSSEENIFFFMTHHIIWDGWSWDIFLSELSQCYLDLSQDQPVSLEPLQIQYTDFTAWQEKFFESEEFARQLEFWKNTLGGTLPTLQIPTDRPRPTYLEHDGGNWKFTVPQKDVEALAAMAREEKATLQMALMAIVSVLLFRYSGVGDQALGIPVQARTQPELENIIGVFVNTLVIRLKATPQMTFRELIRQVKEANLEAFGNQDIPFDKLVDELNPKRDPSRTPIYQVLFSYQDARNRGSEFARMKREQLHVDHDVAPTDISFGIMEYGTGLHCGISYRKKLFDEATIQRLSNHFKSLIQSVIAEKNAAIDKIDFVGLEELELLDNWNATDREYPKDACVHELFEDQAAAAPDKIAVEYENDSITYKDLNIRANQLAGHLEKSGIGAGSIVGLCMERSIDMVIAMLGILKAGAAYIPIDPFYPKDRIAFVLEDSGAQVLVTQRSLDITLSEIDCQRIYTNDQIPTIYELKPNRVSSKDLAYIIYTSGSTGKPKGVEIEHHALMNFLLSMQKAPGLEASDTLLAVTTLSFDISGLEIFLPLITGATISLASRETSMDAESLISQIERSKATLLQATPVTWRMLLAAKWQGSQRIKALIGGEAVPQELANQLQDKCASIWNMYGPTETTIWSTICKIEPNAAEMRIGQPIDNTQILIVDNQLQLQPIGTVGEILIGGDGLARGYRNRPDLTAEKFIIPPFDYAKGKRFYRTGDLGRWHNDGQLECLGRIDSQVKIRGFRIELGEIEKSFSSVPGIKQAVVDAKDFGPEDKRLVAYLQMIGNATIDTETSRRILLKRLPEYMVPNHFLAIDTIPMTPNGKIDRKSLPLPETDNIPIIQYIAPEGETEIVLAEIFKKILKVETVGAQNSFFDLGGNSLSAVKLMMEIEKVLGKRLPLASLFMHTDVRGLAELIHEQDNENLRWNCLTPISTKGEGPPMFLIHGAGGNILLYRELSHHLSPQNPVYGFQSLGLDQNSSPLGSVTEMATRYVNELLAFQPQGPYHIGGYCMGGIIALEMARQLDMKGKEIGLVALLDSYNLSQVDIARSKGNSISFAFQKTKFHLANLLRLKPHDILPYLKEKSRLLFENTNKRIAIQISRISDTLRGRKSNSQTITDIIHDINHTAGWTHSPKFYAGDVVLYKPKKNYDFFQDEQMGWGNVVGGKIEQIEIATNPHSMLIEPFAANLAQSLQEKMLHERTDSDTFKKVSLRG